MVIWLSVVAGSVLAVGCGTDATELTVDDRGRVAEIPIGADVVQATVAGDTVVTAEWTIGERPSSFRYPLDGGTGTSVDLPTLTDNTSVVGLVADGGGGVVLVASSCANRFDGDTCDEQAIVASRLDQRADAWSEPEIVYRNPIREAVDMSDRLAATLIGGDVPLIRIAGGEEVRLFRSTGSSWEPVERPGGWPAGQACGTDRFLYTVGTGSDITRVERSKLVDGPMEQVERGPGVAFRSGGMGCVASGLVVAANPPNDVTDPKVVVGGLSVHVLADGGGWTEQPVPSEEGHVEINLNARQIDDAVVLDYLSGDRSDTDTIREHHLVVAADLKVSEPYEANRLGATREIVAVDADGRAISRVRARTEEAE